MKLLVDVRGTLMLGDPAYKAPKYRLCVKCGQFVIGPTGANVYTCPDCTVTPIQMTHPRWGERYMELDAKNWEKINVAQAAGGRF